MCRIERNPIGLDPIMRIGSVPMQALEVDARGRLRILDAESEAVATMDDEQGKRACFQHGWVWAVGIDLDRAFWSVVCEEARSRRRQVVAIGLEFEHAEMIRNWRIE